MTTQSAVCSFFLSSILSLNSRQLFLSLKTWLGREWRDGRQRERQRVNKSACRIAIEKADGIDPNRDGRERRRERMRDGGEGEGEASEAALWDRWAPGVRLGLSASLSCCSPIAPHSRRLRGNEGSMAACQREKRRHFETIRRHTLVCVSRSRKTLALSLQRHRHILKKNFITMMLGCQCITLSKHCLMHKHLTLIGNFWLSI